MKTIEVVYIGDEFYSASKSMMSPIYLVDGTRYDWGFLQTDLRLGKEIHIRQANEAEMTKYKVKLANVVMSQQEK